MNAYIVFVNGLLAGPDLFDIRALNSAEHGRFLSAEVMADEIKSEVKTIDIFEVRASNVVSRYRAQKTDIDVGDKLVAKCQRVETTF